ncbi:MULTISPECIES: hypothetical protein [Curtobacterium]|uniref:hypothetical protein n=1 Tax=Curtobacterium flaccumfaciens TaxID=2035 RepID=UPI003EE476B2
MPIIILRLVAHAADCNSRVGARDARRVATLLAGGADQRRKAVNALLRDDAGNQQSWARLGELTAMIEDLGRSPQHEIIEQRIASLEREEQLYQFYRIVTWLSHAGTEVA